METPPSQAEVKATSAETKTTHSVVGCLSAIFGVFALFAAILFIYLMTSDLIGSVLDILGMFSIGITVICTLPALILGIIGLFLKNRKKLFPIIGVSISGLFVLIAAVVFIYVFSITRFNTGKLPLRDSFTQKNWEMGTYADHTIQYYQGTLQFIISTKNLYELSSPKISFDTKYSYENVHIEVTAIANGTDPQTAFGIMCNKQSVYSSSYYFGITPEGKYAIAKFKRGENDVILTNNGNWATSDLIVQNADSYRIGADCYNGNLTLYVDGKQIDSVYDASYTKGGFALFVMSGSDTTNTIVGFDDFLMKKK